MSLEMHLRIVGAMLLVLAVSHAFYPRRFGWIEELRRLSLFTRQVFVVHCLFIALFLGLCAMLALFGTRALLEPTALGKWVAGGLTALWSVRLYAQFFIYEVRLWRGNRFHTAMHVLFSCIWCYFVGVFGYVCMQQCRG